MPFPPLALCFPLFCPNPLFWPSGQIFSSISPQCEVTQSAPITILVTEINNLVPLQLKGKREGWFLPLFNPHVIFSFVMFLLLPRSPGFAIVSKSWPQANVFSSDVPFHLRLSCITHSRGLVALKSVLLHFMYQGQCFSVKKKNI